MLQKIALPRLPMLSCKGGQLQKVWGKGTFCISLRKVEGIHQEDSDEDGEAYIGAVAYIRTKKTLGKSQ